MAFTTTPQSESTINQPPAAKVNRASAAIDAFKAAQAAQESGASPQEAIKIAASRHSQSNQHPVQNPSRVSPEEMSVVSPQQQQAQTDNNVAHQPQEVKPPAQDPLSAQYAMLARKEKAYRQKVQEYQAQAEALKAEKAQLATQEAEYKNKYISRDQISSDPLGTLSQLGVTYDQLTQLILNQPNTPQGHQESQELRKLREEVKSLRDGQDEVRKSIQDRENDNYNQALSQIRTEASQLVRSDSSFEAIKATNSIGDVVDLIERTFKEDGYLMTVEESATQVENYLIEEAIKLANLNKVRTKLQGNVTPPKQSESPGQKPTPKTLTNAMSTTPKMNRRDRAVAVAEGRIPPTSK